MAEMITQSGRLVACTPKQSPVDAAALLSVCVRLFRNASYQTKGV